MTKSYRVGTKATNLKVGDVLESVFGNQFRIEELTRWGNHVRVVVDEIGTDNKQDMHFKWDTLVYVSKRA